HEALPNGERVGVRVAGEIAYRRGVEHAIYEDLQLPGCARLEGPGDVIPPSGLEDGVGNDVVRELVARVKVDAIVGLHLQVQVVAELGLAHDRHDVPGRGRQLVEEYPGLHRGLRSQGWAIQAGAAGHLHEVAAAVQRQGVSWRWAEIRQTPPLQSRRPARLRVGGHKRAAWPDEDGARIAEGIGRDEAVARDLERRARIHAEGVDSVGPDGVRD